MQSEESLRSIGKYEVLGTLGRGSMGVVYRARDPEIGREVAVKTLRRLVSAQFHSADQALERFRIEARSAGNLRHPNLITIFDVSRDGDTPFIVMDFVEGESLDAIIKAHGKLDPALMLNYLTQAGKGLDYAHARGVIHRDIKPSNLLVDKGGSVFILDFGVATITGSFAESETSGASSLVMGTPGYMSPEQILNEKLDSRSDLFSLAIVAFECLAGKRPFPGDNFTQVVGNILEARPLSLTSLVPELPLALEAEFERALAKKREDRFKTAAEMMLAFGKALGMSVNVDPSAVSPQAPKERKRKLSAWQTFRGQGKFKNADPDAVFGQQTIMGEKPREHHKQAPAEDPQAAADDRLPIAREQPKVPPWSKSIYTSNIGWHKKVNTAGDMFRGRGSEEWVAPHVKKTRSPMVPITVASICLVAGALLLWYTFFSQPSEVPPALPPGTKLAADGMPMKLSTKVPEPLPPLVRPSTEPVPAGKTVEELSDNQLIGVIVGEKSSEGQIIQALKEAKRRSVAGLLEACAFPLRSDSYLVRIEAVKILAELGDRAAVPQLMLVLDDHDPLVRAQAAKALGTLGDHTAVPYLSARMLREDSPEAKTYIKQAIDKINGFSADSVNSGS